MANLATKYLERRAFGRRECAIEAVAVVGRTNHDIIIRNFSESGALVEFPEGVQIPEKFTVRLVKHKTEGRCEVRHRKAGRVGVQFVTGTVGARLEREYQEHIGRAQVVAAPTALPQRHTHLRLVQTSGAELRRNLMSQISQSALVPEPAPVQNVAIREGHMSDPQSDAGKAKAEPVEGSMLAAEESTAGQGLPSEVRQAPTKLKVVQPEPLLLPI